jgi:hypothetical protein
LGFFVLGVCVIAFYLSMVFTFSPSGVEAFELNFSPVFYLEAVPITSYFYSGEGIVPAMSLPHVIIVNPEYSRYPDLLEHELTHIRQLQALGPAFWLGYGLTLGEAFEPYSVRLGEQYGGHEDMWSPPDAMLGNCPMLRILASPESEGRLELLPCYF